MLIGALIPPFPNGILRYFPGLVAELSGKVPGLDGLVFLIMGNIGKAI